MAAVRPQEPGRSMEPGGTDGAALWRRHLQRSAGRGAGAELSADRAVAVPLGWDLEEERWALKEDQRLHRSRARKYLMETNRRRRAFEERQKQKEEQEQRFRERVLQQRKMKFWETTEKFQRAHLPASQHKQIVQTKAAFQLEEALEQIKGSVLTSGLCLPSRNKTTGRTTDDTSYSSASRNGYSHQEQISAMVGLDKTMQESSRTSVDNNRLLFQKNLKEMQQLLEKQHLSNLENFHEEVDRTDDSESLSSLDSLEAGEQNAICTPLSEPSLTTSCDCAPCIPGKSQIRSDVSYAAQNTSKNTHLNNCQRNIDSQNTHHDLPTEGLLAKRNVLTLANDTEEKPPVPHRSGKKVAEFSTSGNQESSVNKAFPILQNRKEERNDSSSGICSTLATSPSVFSSRKAWASPGSTPGERVQDLMQNQSFKMTPQKRSKSVQTSTEPIATSRIFPNQRCFSGNPSPDEVVPKNRNVSMDFFKNTLGKVIERKEENIKSIDDIDQKSALLQDIPHASAACNVKKQNNKEEEKANVVETMSVVSDTELGFGTAAQHSSQKNSIYDRKRAKLLSSIFKKEAEAVVMNHGITFGTRPVSDIRDSLELAKSKKKSAENTKSGRKLKWCDQINQIIVENNESCYEESISERSAQVYCVHTVSNAPCANPCMGAHPSNTTVTENRHENPHIPKPNVNSAKSNKECTSLNMLMSTGFSFPKNVWMVSKHEASESPVSANDDNIHEENQHKNKAKIIRSTRPIRDQLCSVPRSHRGRGTAVRVQSATGGRAAQGRMLVPQPPSAPAPRSKRGKSRASPAARQPLPSSRPQDTSINGNSLSEGQAWLAHQILNKGTPGSSESRTCGSEVATVLSTHHCSTSCEPLAMHSGCVSSRPTAGCQLCSVTCTEQRASTGNTSHHGHIPTAEETTAWKGARIALSTTDPAAGVAQHRMSHYNNSHATKRQPCKAVSCIPTGDSSQKTCFKASSRMNKLGFFHANSVVPVTKQRRIFNGFENKHGACTDQGRQTVDSRRWKPTHHTQNLLRTVQLRPVQSAFDPAQNRNYTCESEEESTAQFLIAEKLTRTAAAEDEILAAMGSVQPARQPLLLNTAPRRGISALSIEEEKIFQSLDRLNQRLLNVQEAIARNPSVSGILQKTSPFVSV
ncbi:centrosomal protein of 126 kDa isoform X1 [Coturnix japonica]|uniref:centrosomal protein of 126 kDa isoform X1 n=1 Tax=Coturnix japonica TaxID=93934 RepID=UPI0013A5DE41|nr:centrosomal protein of 126 kDa isoform X1 [Coturnix japonica]